MKKCCMNCMRMFPIYDGLVRNGQGCQLDPTMRVNRRMVCGEWLSSDIPDRFTGAVSVSGLTQRR